MTTPSQRVVLVLGGTGFIGSHVVERLAREHVVRAFGRRPSPWTPPEPGVDYRWGDFVGGKGLREALAGVDIVVHCISTTIPKTSNAVMELDITTNLVGTVRLLDLCIGAGVRRVVFVSSGGTVYGASRSFPISESSPTEPLVSHGIIKLAIEKYLAVFKRNHGLSYVVLRASNVFGPRQNPAGQQGLINVVLGRIARDEPVEIYGDESTKKDYVYVADFVEACARAITASDDVHGIVNIGSGTGLTIREVLDEAKTVTKKPVEVRYRPPLAGDVTFVLDVSRARHELGWAPRWSFPDGLLETWLWTKTCYGQ